jgi:hypothetical protein
MRRGLSFAVLTVLSLVVVAAAAAAGDRHQSVVVQCPGSCDSVAAGIESLGGKVTYRFVNVNALVALVPESRMTAVAALSGSDPVRKDLTVTLPPPNGGGGATATIPAEDGRVLSTDVTQALPTFPADFSFNNALINVATLHAQGKQGQGVIVAVIDSGVANSSAVGAISGSVIGGETLVPASDPIVSPTSRYNGPHGTWVGTTIAGHALFLFSNTSVVVQTLKMYAPDSVIPCPGPYACNPALSVVPVIGSAPGAKLYALKVFASNSDSAPTSRISAAMDRAITLRHNYNMGVPSVPVSGDGTENNPYKYDSLKIDVVNLSLGGPTLISGDDVEDQLTRKMVEEGMIVTVSAGNGGFGAMTVGSPGTGTGSLTVAAASSATHERILREAQFGAGYGAGIGLQYRPFSGLQTADFSSRGPTADGRFGPNVSANGFATFAQGTCTTACTSAPFSWVSGTSFSAPTAAGVAAVLRREAPTASAAQIRNAIIQSANARAFGDGSGQIDRGLGLLDAEAALKVLDKGWALPWLPSSYPWGSVMWNAARTGNFPVFFRRDTFSSRAGNLLPGQVAQFFVETDRWTDRLTVTLKNVKPADPQVQNVLFGDDVVLTVLDAPTSFAVPAVQPTYVIEDQTFVIDNPQTGIVRVAVQGDTTNAGRISADVVITRHRAPLSPETADGRVKQGDEVPVKFDVPAGTKELVCELFWDQDWSRYPTNDLDLVLLSPDPAAAPNYDGATLNSPERVVIKEPLAGTWLAAVQAFTVHTAGHDRRPATDQFVLRVTADGKRLKAVK